MLLAAANAWQPIADALYSTPQAWRVSTSWRLWPFTPLTPALSSPLRGVAMKRELTTEDEKVGRSVPAEPPRLVPAPCLRLARDGSPYLFHSRGSRAVSVRTPRSLRPGLWLTGRGRAPRTSAAGSTLLACAYWALRATRATWNSGAFTTRRRSAFRFWELSKRASGRVNSALFQVLLPASLTVSRLGV